jgi:SPP1 gp7 family putative phage head morphogenesis protein|nr:MAG TPA: minor capsid protein [Caudoviricetes sp.]
MPTPDKAHQLTDEELKKLERRIASIYRKARDELQETVDAYFESFAKRDEEMKDLIGTFVNGREWTEQDYKQWRLAQIGRGKRFETLRDKVAERMTKANETAVSYVNDATPGIYSLNRNYAAYTIEQVAGDVGFDILDEQTVKRLIVERPDLMPYYPTKKAVKRGIDLTYGKKQITSTVTSGILQGKSIKGLADDLQTRIPTMNRDSAIRTARTAVTGAQNAGRIDSYAAARKMGIKLQKEWLATLDGRTRHSHAMLDGEKVDTDAKFSNGCRFPGDPQGRPEEVYNCRCTLIASFPDVNASKAQRRARNSETGENKVISDMTYQEWMRWKRGS